MARLKAIAKVRIRSQDKQEALALQDRNPQVEQERQDTAPRSEYAAKTNRRL